MPKPALRLSKKLALLYRAATVRVQGSGKWVREESGSWTLQQFDITSFEVLNDGPLIDVVSNLPARSKAATGVEMRLLEMLSTYAGEKDQPTKCRSSSIRLS